MSTLGLTLSLSRIPERFARVVVVSPHMDDAILSCGGLLQSLVPKMECISLTICTADPENADPLNPPHGIALPSVRRGEEVSAMQALGCELVQLNLLDAIYRRHSATGKPLYPHMDSLWTMPHQDDDAQRKGVAEGLRPYLSDTSARPTLFLSPAGIGHHVDHILCTATLLSLVQHDDNVLLYEDFPYVVDQGAHVGIADSIEHALLRLNVLGEERLEQECDVDAKISLIENYATQIDSIFGSHDNVKPLLLKNARAGKTLERFWRIKKK